MEVLVRCKIKQFVMQKRKIKENKDIKKSKPNCHQERMCFLQMLPMK